MVSKSNSDLIEKALPYGLIALGAFLVYQAIKPKSVTDYPIYDPTHPCPYGQCTSRGFFGDCPPNYTMDSWPYDLTCGWNVQPGCKCNSQV